MPASQNATTRSGLDAALAVASSVGLPVGDPRVLSARGNLVVHLAPAPVVARVATLTAWSRRDPAAWMRREVAVASAAAAAGAAVLAPADGVDPGPHVGGAHPVTLWSLGEVEERRPTPATVGAALARLHARSAAVDLDLPWLTPLHEQVDDALARITARSLLPPDRVDALRRRRDEALEAIGGHDGPVGVLHGDAHAGNLVRAGGRWCWTDFEESCRGPLAWDLATLAESTGPLGAGPALAAYAATAGVEVPGAATLAPFVAGRRVEAAVWIVAMADVFPQRYAPMVEPSLASALG